MHNTKSDTSENETISHKSAVREFLRDHGEFASKDALRAGTDVPAWYIDQIAAKDAFYTSLNHNGEYVASKYVVGHRSTQDGFWRPEVDDGEAVFHRKEDTKPTLKHLAFKRPSGLTPSEANDLLGHRCYRPLRQLAEQQEVYTADWQDTTVYTHSWPSRWDDQLTQRETDHPTDVTPDDPDGNGYLYRDGSSQRFSQWRSHRSSQFHLNEPLHSSCGSSRATPSMPSNVAFGVTTRSETRWSTLSQSDVPSGTSLWRAFDDLQSDELRDCLQSMCGELLADHDHAGEFVVIDSTHIAAWANTREEIENDDVEGAS